MEWLHISDFDVIMYCSTISVKCPQWDWTAVVLFCAHAFHVAWLNNFNSRVITFFLATSNQECKYVCNCGVNVKPAHSGNSTADFGKWNYRGVKWLHAPPAQWDAFPRTAATWCANRMHLGKLDVCHRALKPRCWMTKGRITSILPSKQFHEETIGFAYIRLCDNPSQMQMIKKCRCRKLGK